MPAKKSNGHTPVEPYRHPDKRTNIPTADAAAAYGIADDASPRFNALRNYVFSQATMMGLYETLATSGKDGLAKTVAGIVSPA